MGFRALGFGHLRFRDRGVSFRIRVSCLSFLGVRSQDFGLRIRGVGGKDCARSFQHLLAESA